MASSRWGAPEGPGRPGGVRGAARMLIPTLWHQPIPGGQGAARRLAAAAPAWRSPATPTGRWPTSWPPRRGPGRRGAGGRGRARHGQRGAGRGQARPRGVPRHGRGPRLPPERMLPRRRRGLLRRRGRTSGGHGRRCTSTRSACAPTPATAARRWSTCGEFADRPPNCRCAIDEPGRSTVRVDVDPVLPTPAWTSSSTPSFAAREALAALDEDWERPTACRRLVGEGQTWPTSSPSRPCWRAARRPRSSWADVPYVRNDGRPRQRGLGRALPRGADLRGARRPGRVIISRRAALAAMTQDDFDAPLTPPGRTPTVGSCASG